MTNNHFKRNTLWNKTRSVQLAENESDALLLVIKPTVTLWMFCVIAAVSTPDGSNQSLRQTLRRHRGRQLHHNRTQTARQFREEVQGNTVNIVLAIETDFFWTDSALAPAFPQ